MGVETVMVQGLRRSEAADLDTRIRRAKAALGKRAVILGHHYQREEVYRHADFHGDSLQLSRAAAGQEAEFIVFAVYTSWPKWRIFSVVPIRPAFCPI